MQLKYLLFPLIVLFVLFLISEKPPVERQAQEEPSARIFAIAERTYRIEIQILNEKQRDVADILWFHEAAKLARAKKIPWFNVIEEKITPTSVKGIITLVRDPMAAEYDAEEILQLELRAED